MLGVAWKAFPVYPVGIDEAETARLTGNSCGKGESCIGADIGFGPVVTAATDPGGKVGVRTKLTQPAEFFHVAQRIDSGTPAVEVILVKHGHFPEIAESAEAGERSGFFSCGVQCREEHPRKDSDNGDRYQKFYEGEV